MAPTNWPPALGTPWPAIWSSFDLESFLAHLESIGWTNVAPTAQERSQFFDDARCSLGHPVVGRMVVTTGGVRYPFAGCNTNHDASGARAALVLWEPYEYVKARPT